MDNDTKITNLSVRIFGFLLAAKLAWDAGGWCAHGFYEEMERMVNFHHQNPFPDWLNGEIVGAAFGM